jgi:CRP/FNR family cyclic AMP-dependent transcriptional regulator
MEGTLSAELHEFLRDAFACSPDVAASIGRRAIDRHFAAKAVILRQGERAGAAFLLVAGRAHALLYAVEGQVLLLHEFLPGDFFGALASSPAEPEEADILAIEDVRALAFFALDFLMLLEAHACVGLALSRMLLRRLRATSERMAERTTLSAAGRVHAELLRLARLGDGHSVRPVPVLAALAVRVHSTRETVSRAINALERRGIVRRDADALVIVAPHRLEELIV